ncbi:MAG TPA: tyrosine-type recombinase/integrase [Burkholderiales bacterium]|nr:tyrosine-type recombinase/integrase [Burkholderiales bacterium]
MRRWDRLSDAYLEQYQARGLAEGTVARTRHVLQDWGHWMKSRRPRPVLERIDAQLLVRYVESRSSFRAKATVYATLSTMRGMGEFLVREGIWQANPLRWMKGPKITPYSRLPRRIDRAHMEALWRAAAASPGEYRRHLWLTVLALLYGTGLRRGELERLDLESFERDEGLLRIDGRKTGRERCVPVPDLTRRCLEAYLPLRHNHLERLGVVGEHALLVNRSGERLAAHWISQGVHALAGRAGIPIVSLHQFRHSCASDLLGAGVHLAEVQRLLGHQRIATTVRYTHIADPQRREAIARHPINAWLAAGSP